MPAYYNEIDKHAAAWLRELIRRNLIAPGDVDERSIVDVDPKDLDGYEQCHFFAGIGGWSYALRLAGWADARPVWTGSCPCQPFSTSGAKAAHDDRRHLWPAWFNVILERRPGVVFGEQVASGLGRAWLDHVCADLESAAYAAAAANLPACCVGAPHGRARLWFVAHADARGRHRLETPRVHERREGAVGGEAAERSAHGTCRDDVDGRRQDGILVYADGERGCGWQSRSENAADARLASQADPWSDIEWVECSDGKRRPTQSGIRPLAHGIPARVGRLRGYGNAIVPQVAAAFVQAVMQCS